MPGFSSQLSTPDDGSTCRTKRREVSGVFNPLSSDAPHAAPAQTAATTAKIAVFLMAPVYQIAPPRDNTHMLGERFVR